MSSKQLIRLRSPADRWRYTCPKGHRSWEVTNNHFWCQQCATGYANAEPEFDELRDRKTGALIPRDRLALTLRGGEA